MEDRGWGYVLSLPIHDLDWNPKLVECQKVPDRPRDPAKWNEIADVVSALSIPVIANGDVFEYDDFERIKSATGASSVMVARGALWNASMFSPEGKVSYEAVKREYIRKCILWDNDLKSTKHTLKEMIMHYSCLELPEGKAVIKSESMADLAINIPSSFGDYLIMGLHPSITVMLSLLASLPVLA
ncbi:tRNA-dihydrouridine(20) synthase [NAD(P)+]-like [Glycine soja]|uniref:tRNA-dihydrouridine(20) synthase [NAD(P)+]-like n=1 Tax=Glycine soja TaxID=3848 RepID=A0A445M150_GLYSO|nr:tRNA-dihydrouridine(20) synthase [NAD(P)+]-like [Glycine soja]